VKRKEERKREGKKGKEIEGPPPRFTFLARPLSVSVPWVVGDKTVGLGTMRND